MPDIEVWPFSENVSQRQIEEWSQDPDNVAVDQMPLVEKRLFLKTKAELLGRDRTDWYFRKLGVPLRGNVLEIGAGICWLSSYMSSVPEIESVVAVELSLERIRAFKDVALEAFPGADQRKIRYAQGDFHRINAPDNTFDIVTGDAVLHHADNLVCVLREVWRVLKPGGHYLGLREPTISHLRRPPRFNTRYPEDGSAMYYYRDGWKSAFINAWFEAIRLSDHIPYGRVKGFKVPWAVRRLLRKADIRIHYPMVCISARKPLSPKASG